MRNKSVIYTFKIQYGHGKLDAGFRDWLGMSSILTTGSQC